jgi:hypothetical protein
MTLRKELLLEGVEKNENSGCFNFSQKLVPLTHNPPTPLWNNPLPPFPLNKGGQRGLYKGEGDWGRGVVYKVARGQEGKTAIFI